MSRLKFNNPTWSLGHALLSLYRVAPETNPNGLSEGLGCTLKANLASDGHYSVEF